MNVHNMLSHGDTPMFQIWHAFVKSKMILPIQKFMVKIILISRPKIKVIQRSEMYETHYPMVIHSCARYGMTMSLDKKAVAQTLSHLKNHINLTLRSNVNISRSWINATHSCIVIDPCAKYAMLISKQSDDMGMTRRHVKTSLILTMWSKIKVVLGSWMYVTHHLMVTNSCAKCGKSMSKQKKVMSRTRICTDRQSDSYIPPELPHEG